MNSSKLLSVVTVNYNSGPLFERTFNSILALISHIDVEFIVVDSCSTDESGLSIERFKSSIDHLIVEKDEGIYDAMNKGIDFASGEWVIFINSGDTLNIAAHYLLQLIRNVPECSNLIYSNFMLNGNTVVHQRFSLWYLLISSLNHQNIIYRSCLVEHKFDKKYNICADYHHLIDCYEFISPYKLPENVSICDYDTSGMSSRVDRLTRLRLWTQRMKCQLNSSLKLRYKAVFVLVSGFILLIKFFFPKIFSRSSYEKK